MSQEDENKMVYALLKGNVSKEHIEWIINDLRKSGTFNDGKSEDPYDEDDGWDLIEQQAFWIFDSNTSSSDRLKALKKINDKKKQQKDFKKTLYLEEQEKRIQAKMKELVEAGEIEPDEKQSILNKKSKTRYGRTPLHEAIAIKDIKSIERYLEMDIYLEEIDNNGHTPWEMAYYYNYQEALLLFEKYNKKVISE